MNFNLTLPSFEPNLKAVRNLVELALSSPFTEPPRVQFVSSIGIFERESATSFAAWHLLTFVSGIQTAPSLLLFLSNQSSPPLPLALGTPSQNGSPRRSFTMLQSARASLSSWSASARCVGTRPVIGTSGNGSRRWSSPPYSHVAYLTSKE